MILPPFYGIASKYDEPEILKAIISYLAKDSLTYKDPTEIIHHTFLQADCCTHGGAQTEYIGVSFLGCDILTYGSGSLDFGGTDSTEGTTPDSGGGTTPDSGGGSEPGGGGEEGYGGGY